MMDYNLSIWEKRSYWFDRDYIIVGGGITGLMSAIHLAKLDTDASIGIIEAQPIGTLASSRNAGFACFGSISELESDRENYGLDRTLEIVKMRYTGLQLLRSLIGDRVLKYEGSGGTEVFDTKEAFEKYSDKLSFWNQSLSSIIGVSDTFSIEKNHKRFSFYNSTIRNRLEGLIDTGALMLSMERKARDLNIHIYRGLRLNHYAMVPGGVDLHFDQIRDSLHCKQLILCTNSLTKHILQEEDVVPSRNQVILTSKVDTNGIKGGYHYDSGYTYFRELDGRILLGGARNKFPEEDGIGDLGMNQSNLDHLLEFLETRLLGSQEFRIEREWSGILSGGSDRTPIIKRINDHITMAARLGGMGIAIGSLVGQEAATLAVKHTF